MLKEALAILEEVAEAREHRNVDAVPVCSTIIRYIERTRRGEAIDVRDLTHHVLTCPAGLAFAVQATLVALEVEADSNETVLAAELLHGLNPQHRN